MIAEIITIGLEVTTGSILNTNSKYISNKLLELGIDTYYHTSVDDNKERLEEVINNAIKRADLIITTGGLGPTDDDITKEVIAYHLGLSLIKNEDIENQIRNKFSKLNKSMPTNNIKQAIIPEGCHFLVNHMGTAPGIFLLKGNKKIILLPGPPREMEFMFDNEVVPLIKGNDIIVKKSINLIGIGESDLEMKIKDLIHGDEDIIIATYPKEVEVEIKIIGKGTNRQIVGNKIDEIINVLNSRFSDYIYSYDNISIEEVVFNILKNRNLKIGFCESCTGGLIMSRFTRIPGVSSVFEKGIVTYSNEAKIQEVGVNPKTLEKFGAVSKETAIEMSKGLLKLPNIDVALSVTGIAGPDGGTSEKPVGTVYISISNKEKTIVEKFNMSGSREYIQNRTSTLGFNEIRKFLLNL